MKKQLRLAWIPNTVTMGNLIFGFLSIVYSANLHIDNHLQIAGLMIILATIFDGFDGQVARALKVNSELGKQLDSLADLVTFGVAPGYLAYQMFLSDLILTNQQLQFNYGMIIAAIFPICAAYRLARFNVQTTTTYFQGLPSPIAGIVIALQPLIFHNVDIPALFSILFFVATALLMVSTIRYSKPQTVLVEKLRGFKLIISIILLVVFFFFLQKWALVIIIALYLISGLVNFIIHLIQVNRL